MLQGYDRVLGSRSIETLVALSGLVIFLFGMIGVLDYARGRIVGRVAARFQSRLDRRVFEAVIRKSALNPDERTATQPNLQLAIIAPVSGVIHDMQIFALRSVLCQVDPVLFIVPQDRALIINVQIEPIHIDKLHLGQGVSLGFPALDQRQTPELTGQVAQVSADAFDDAATGQSILRAEIVLSDGEQARLPQGHTLIPRMPVEAYIRTGDHTPIAYLVKPLADYFSRAFRE